MSEKINLNLITGQTIIFKDGNKFVITAITKHNKDMQVTLKQIEPIVKKEVRFISTLTRIKKLLSINFLSIA